MLVVVTAWRDDCQARDQCLRSVAVKPLDIFWLNIGTFSSLVFEDRSKIREPNYYLFITLTNTGGSKRFGIGL